MGDMVRPRRCIAEGKPRGCYAARTEITESLAVPHHIMAAAHRLFPVQWPRYYLDLTRTEAIARMGRPTVGELLAADSDIPDPIADRSLRPIPFLVRKHGDRVIILAAKKCHFYCRFCFRREEPVTRSAEPGAEDWARIFAFLTAHPEIEEPILSGGDPLTLDDETLFRIRDAFRQIESVRKWRIHTRAPVHFPARVTEPLVAGLVSDLPLCVVTHYNHDREITGQAREIANLMRANGIEYKNQAVLLAGVNDSIEAQVNLWRGLDELGITPHYLHHPDRVPGNAPFRLTITRGQQVYHGLSVARQGPIPPYVLDLPDGRGKVPVRDLVPIEDGLFSYTHPDGSVSHYRDIPT